MDIPVWVQEFLKRYDPPTPTGQVVITLERYQGGVTHVEVAGVERVKPPAKS